MSAGHEREREVDDRIADWVDGRLSDRDHERFVAELRVNPQLRRDLEEYENTVATVRRALQAPTEPAQLADRVLASIAAGRRPTTAGGGSWRRGPVLWSLATAAAVFVVALLVDAWSAPAAPGKSTQTATYEGASELAGDGPSGSLRRQDGGQDDRAPTASDFGATLRERPPVGEPGAKVDPVRDAAGTEPEQQAQDDVHARRLGVTDREVTAPVTGSGALAPAPGAPTAGPGTEQGVEPATGVMSEGRRGAVPPGDEKGESGEKVAGQDPLRPGEPMVVSLAEESVDTARTTPAAEDERQRLVGAVTTVVEPMPLVVVLGRAPAAANLFAMRARKDKAGPAAATEEAKAAGELGLRFDEFFTAQVAQMAQPPRTARMRKEAKSPATESAEQPAGWLQVGGLRLLRLEPTPEPAGAQADGREPTEWIERDWLVDGRRHEVAGLLGRLAEFAGAAELELRTGETTEVASATLLQEHQARPADGPERRAERDAEPAAERQRLVLRFRLQPR